MKIITATALALSALFVAAHEVTAQSVVVNEFRNQTPDAIELLVIQNNLDMRGMIVKDYSSSGANDSGGGYTFSTSTLWSSVPAGTLIVLRKDNTAADITVGGADYNLDVGLLNTTYFTVGSGTFDLATEELVQIKASGSGQAGSAGAIHTLASAAAGAQYTSSPTPKLKASTGNSGTSESVEAGNGTSAIGDFNGTDALGDGAVGSLGTWNNANNQTYITTLRGGGGETTNVQFTASSATVGEAAGTALITVYKSSANGDVTAQIQLGGTAASPADYTVDTTNISLNGSVTSQTVTVSITDDGDLESAETVALTLANVTVGLLGSPSTYTLTITDNDAPIVTNVQFTAAAASVGESSGAYTVTVYKTLASGDVSGSVALSGTAVNAGDYTVGTTNFTLAGATTSATFVVTIADDAETESAETVILTLADVTGGTVASPSAFTLTITANDSVAPAGQPWINEVDYDSVGTDTNEWVEIAGPAGLSLNDYELLMISDAGAVYATNDLAGASWTFADEGNGYGFFVIGRVLAGEGTADYTPATWTQDKLQNGPNDSVQLRQKTGSVNVHLLDYEGNNTTTTDDQNTTAADDNTTALKSIFLAGGPGSGYSAFAWTNTAAGATPGAINQGQSFGAPAVTTNVQFTVSSDTVGEASVSYTVTVFKTLADGVVVGEIALSGTAAEGADYSISSTNISLSGATTSATFVVTLLDDVEVESAETVILTLANVTGGTAGSPSVHTLTITDNDVGQSPPVLAAIGSKATLTNLTLSFEVTAAATDGDPVTLTASNLPGTAQFFPTNAAGTFLWTLPSPAGVYTMSFYAADNDGVDSEQITITVTSSPAPVNLNVWINELHYDNQGADTNEGFEIAGPAGTDLSGYSLVLYNGSAGAPGGVYSNLAASGVIDDESNGYGALWFGFGLDANQVRNGPDAVALVYNGSQVLQFLSYEGTFVATDGPASGMTCTSIGVVESGTTTLGDWSLQLCGTGTNYNDYAWSTNLPHSRGALNDCQVIPAAGNPNDGDGDGLPNQWENQHFGNNTAGNPYDDDDGDGFFNIEEFVAGTIPVTGSGGTTSYFRNVSFSVTGAGVGYPSVTGRLYRLWSITNLMGNHTWVPVGGPQAGNGASQSLQDGSGTTAPVYRLSVEMETP